MVTDELLFSTRVPQALRVGMRLRVGRVLDCVGGGPTGFVYRVHDDNLGAIAVREYFPPALATRIDGMVRPLEGFEAAFNDGLKLFDEDGWQLAAQDHPGLLKVQQVWSERGTSYIAMPWCDGRTLSQKLRLTNELPAQDQLCNWLRAVADALTLVHRRRGLHGHLSPEQVMLLNSGRLLVMEFSRARRVVARDPRDVERDPFAALECGIDPRHGPTGPWTDVYALAAMVYFALRGRPPQAALRRAAFDALEPLAGAAELLEAGYSEEFLRGIDNGLALRARSRPQSLQEFLSQAGVKDRRSRQRAIGESLLSNLPVGDAEPDASTRSEPADEPAPPQPSQTPQTPQTPQPPISAAPAVVVPDHADVVDVSATPVPEADEVAAVPSSKPAVASGDAEDVTDIEARMTGSVPMGRSGSDAEPKLSAITPMSPAAGAVADGSRQPPSKADEEIILTDSQWPSVAASASSFGVDPAESAFRHSTFSDSRFGDSSAMPLGGASRRDADRARGLIWLIGAGLMAVGAGVWGLALLSTDAPVEVLMHTPHPAAPTPTAAERTPPSFAHPATPASVTATVPAPAQASAHAPVLAARSEAIGGEGGATQGAPGASAAVVSSVPVKPPAASVPTAAREATGATVAVQSAARAAGSKPSDATEPPRTETSASAAPAASRTKTPETPRERALAMEDKPKNRPKPESKTRAETGAPASSAASTAPKASAAPKAAATEGQAGSSADRSPTEGPSRARPASGETVLSNRCPELLARQYTGQPLDAAEREELRSQCRQ